MGLSISKRKMEVVLNNGVRRRVDEGHWGSRNFVAIDSRMFDPKWPGKHYVSKLITQRMRATGEDFQIAATRISTVTGKLNTYEGLVPGMVRTLFDAFVSRVRASRAAVAAMRPDSPSG